MQGIFGAVLGIWLVDAVRFLGSLAWGKETMGAGDGKLLAAIGAWLGPGLMVISGFLGAFLGAVIGTGAIALGLLRRSQPMPFGPFLALGGAIAAIWGETLLNLYLEIFFPAGVL
jgi:leader peptidase (prepilin peptidase)/N-methyltransferase